MRKLLFATLLALASVSSLSSVALAGPPAAAKGPYDAAIARFDAGDVDGALGEIARVAKARPQDGIARYYEGVFLEKKGDAAAAEKAYREAIRLAPKQAEPRSNLCALRFAAGDAAEAIAQCEKAVGLSDGYGVAWYNLGLAYGAGGRGQDAARAFVKATTIEPANVDAWMNLGKTRLGLGDKKGAVIAFRQATQRAPQEAQTHFNLGNVLAASGDLDGAARALAESVRLAPTFAPGPYRLGSVERRRGQHEQAVAALTKAKALSAKDPAVALELGMALAARAGSGDAAKAVAEFGRAEKLAPKAWEPPFYLGMVEVSAGHCPKAKQAFARYAAKDPKGARTQAISDALATCGKH